MWLPALIRPMNPWKVRNPYLKVRLHETEFPNCDYDLKSLKLKSRIWVYLRNWWTDGPPIVYWLHLFYMMMDGISRRTAVVHFPWILYQTGIINNKTITKHPKIQWLPIIYIYSHAHRSGGWMACWSKLAPLGRLYLAVYKLSLVLGYQWGSGLIFTSRSLF